jgi:hypothetical protein
MLLMRRRRKSSVIEDATMSDSGRGRWTCDAVCHVVTSTGTMMLQSTNSENDGFDEKEREKCGPVPGRWWVLT